PENWLLQFTCEWGMFVTAVAIAAFAYILGPAAIHRRRSSFWPGLIGAACLILQNLADLSLVVPGVAMALVAVLGACLGEADAERTHAPVAGDSHLRLAASATLGVTSIALVTYCSLRTVDPVTERDNLLRAYHGARETRQYGEVDNA